METLKPQEELRDSAPSGSGSDAAKHANRTVVHRRGLYLAAARMDRRLVALAAALGMDGEALVGFVAAAAGPVHEDGAGGPLCATMQMLHLVCALDARWQALPWNRLHAVAPISVTGAYRPRKWITVWKVK
jgi:hypothetical protein